MTNRMKPVDCVLQALSADKSHCIERTTTGILAQAIDWDDAWMLEAACYLGFD